MPQIGNIVVKKADGTTDFTFVAVSAAPGDGGFAQWEGEGETRATRGSARAKSSWNGSRTVRKVELSGALPLTATDATTGLQVVAALVPFSATFQVPNNVPSSFAADAAAILTGFISSSLIQSSIASGYAPT